jgi:Uma2 family endonuclease
MVAQFEKLATTEILLENPEQVKLYSSEEYLALEVQSEVRSEFRDGAIIPMAGGLPNHNRIVRNLCTLLTVSLRGKPYEVFVTDQRIWIPDWQIHTYPDLMIIEGELQFKEGRKDTVINPLLIVEVLSNSTQDYDRGDKFSAYRSIRGFQEYILIDQYCQHLEHYVKVSPKKWDFQEYDESDLTIVLETIGLEVSIADLYEKVIFEKAKS